MKSKMGKAWSAADKLKEISGRKGVLKKFTGRELMKFLRKRGIKSARAASQGTAAFEYLSGARDPRNLDADSRVVAVVDDQPGRGTGMIYVFDDGSSMTHRHERN